MTQMRNLDERRAEQSDFMKTKAIIFKKQNANEYDQLVTCYTQEFGKMTAIAKSVLKPSSIQAMHLDTFNLVEFELVSGNGFPIITGAQAENTYLKLKSSIKNISAMFVIGDYIDKIVFDYSRDDELWGLLTDVLKKLDSDKEDAVNILKDNQEKLLQILGYYPEIKKQATVLDLNYAFEQIAGRQLKAISFFHQTQFMLK